MCWNSYTKVGINLPRTSKKLYCKGEPYQFIEIKQTDRQTHILILFNRDYCVIKKDTTAAIKQQQIVNLSLYSDVFCYSHFASWRGKMLFSIIFNAAGKPWLASELMNNSWILNHLGIVLHVTIYLGAVRLNSKHLNLIFDILTVQQPLTINEGKNYAKNCAQK